MSRVLVVGWDGATWSIADPLARAGRLPVLAALRGQAAEGVLESVPNMNSAPAWSTIATGLNPGRHGIFYFDERVPGSYGRRIVNANRRDGATLWQIASEAGKRVIVVNVPITYPAQPVNGVLVAGLDTPSRSARGFTYPEDLPARYPGLFRDYVIEPQAPTLMRDGRAAEAERTLLSSVEGWTSLAERLMRTEEWDLAFVVMTSTDTTQHFFWGRGHGEVVHRVYEAQDAATGRLVEAARAADPRVNVVILADHGGAANTRGPEFMRIWLEDQGFLAPASRGPASRLLAAGFDLVNRKLPRERKRALSRWFPRLKERAEAESKLGGIDWDRTRAFSDGVRDDVLVNLAGREPHGTVGPEAYEAFVQELADRIRAITEEGSGRRVVEAVVTRDAYHGPHVERAPDLTIRWVLDGGPFRGFACDTERGRRRTREVAARPPFQPGGHHPEGLFLATGPRVLPTRIRGALADVTPTVLALLGVPVPSGLDGRPLELLAGGVEASSGPPAITSGTAATSGYTPEEEEAIRRRLEGLGYL